MRCIKKKYFSPYSKIYEKKIPTFLLIYEFARRVITRLEIGILGLLNSAGFFTLQIYFAIDINIEI